MMRSQSAYDVVGGLIAGLVARFGLDESRSLIMQVYEEICRDSLDFSMGTRPPGSSRINDDGTPVQFAATVGPGSRTLQFLGEGSKLEASGPGRMAANRACMDAVAQRLQVADALDSCAPLLDVLVPEADTDLLAEPSGAYWVGAAFAEGQERLLRVYINARWGQEGARWTRLAYFARYFGFAAWPEIRARLSQESQPLGAAITFSGDRPPSGRIYLSAYGMRMRSFEEMAERYGGAGLARHVSTFGQCVLGNDYISPAGSAVCSFGLGGKGGFDFKLELCIHCLFASDAQVVAPLTAWCEQAGLDATGYSTMLDILSGGRPSDQRLDLHCYAGVGLRHGVPYGTIYMKPGITRS